MEQRRLRARGVKIRRFAVSAVTVIAVTFAILSAAGWIRSYRVEDDVDQTWMQEGDEGLYALARRLQSYNGGIRCISDRMGPLKTEGRRRAVVAHVGLHWAGIEPPWNGGPDTPDGTPWHRYAGFAVGHMRGRTASPPGVHPTFWLHYADFVVIPYWFLTLVPGIPSLTFLLGKWIVQRRHRRWQRLGLCIQCGYDVRSTSAGPALTDDVLRCPECGLPYVPALSRQAQTVSQQSHPGLS